MDYNYNYNYSVPSDAAAAGVSSAFLFGAMLVWVIIIAAIYIYNAICLMKIAKKTATPNGWFAWIPILNAILMLQIAKKPMWWIIMLLIPFINIIFLILVWMAIAQAVKKPSWWGVMVIIPVMNIIMPGYLAFSKMEEMPTGYVPPTPSAAPPVQPAV